MFHIPAKASTTNDKTAKLKQSYNPMPPFPLSSVYQVALSRTLSNSSLQKQSGCPASGSIRSISVRNHCCRSTGTFPSRYASSPFRTCVSRTRWRKDNSNSARYGTDVL